MAPRVPRLALLAAAAALHAHRALAQSPGGVQGVRAVRVSRLNPPEGHINFAEVQLWTAAGVNVAREGTVSASSTWVHDGYRPASVLNDGVLDRWWANELGDTSPWALITLPVDAAIQRVAIYLRVDPGATDRDVGDTVQLLDAAGGVLWAGTIGSYARVGSPALPVWETLLVSATPTPSALPTPYSVFGVRAVRVCA